jgi:hypothetical protein
MSKIYCDHIYTQESKILKDITWPIMKIKEDIRTKWTLLIRSVIVNQRYMSLFVHLIIKSDVKTAPLLAMDNSYDWAIRLLQKKGSQVANARDGHGDYENGDGESALMLATKLEPVSKAVELIDALMYSGASMETWEYRYYHRVLFYACRNGVDPAVFDKLVMWDAMREKTLQEWWSQCDNNGNGVFVLACESQNIGLVEHILSLAITQHRQENFLEGMPNHILKSLFIHHRDCFREKFMVKWLRVLRKYVDKIPQDYTVGKKEIRHGLDPSRIFYFALLNRMFDFIEEWAALFEIDYNCKETIWRWFHENENRTLKDGLPIDKVDRYGVPIAIWNFALAYERSELWKRNKDITLVLSRGFKAKYQNDILKHISSFLYTTALDAKARNTEIYDARYCCECKGWFVGCCICFNFSGHMPGSPRSSWKSFDGLRSSMTESVQHWISWNS